MPKPGRVVAIDWLRGLAVLVMIQCHAMALLKPELRSGPFYGVLTWIDGLVAPAFILAAGFSLSLAPFLNNKTGSVFAPLPWGGYVYLGAALGAATASGGARSLAKWLTALAGAGIALWILTPQLSSIYPPHEFWVTNPANHARRITQVAAI